jgi:hypothetical protein
VETNWLDGSVLLKEEGFVFCLESYGAALKPETVLFAALAPFFAGLETL